LQGAGKICKGGFERSGISGSSVDGLQLGQDVCHLVGIGAAGCFGTQLSLDELIEFAVPVTLTLAPVSPVSVSTWFVLWVT